MKGPMTPLQKIAMGLVIVFLQTGTAYDIYANPVGWLFVIWGVRALRLTERGVLLGTSLLAFAVSLPLWFPQVYRPLFDVDPALAWATDLPMFAFLILLCRALMRAAKPADPQGFLRFATLSVLLAGLVLVPPIAVASDSAWLATTGQLLRWATQIWLVWSLFSHHARPWAGAEVTAPGRPA